MVLFAHGSGSSRHSPRNRYVARVLNEAGLPTLLVDLLTPDEEAVDMRTGHLRFNIELLAKRLLGAAEWLKMLPETRQLAIGYFGASTGAAAALVAAAERPELAVAVASRGGRPDLAGQALPRVQAPTLLIVGGNDFPVIELNQAAFAQLRCEKQLVIVPGATHLFEEPNALEQMARLARAWFATLSRPHTLPTPSLRASPGAAFKGRARSVRLERNEVSIGVAFFGERSKPYLRKMTRQPAIRVSMTTSISSGSGSRAYDLVRMKCVPARSCASYPIGHKARRSTSVSDTPERSRRSSVIRSCAEIAASRLGSERPR